MTKDEFAIYTGRVVKMTVPIFYQCDMKNIVIIFCFCLALWECDQREIQNVAIQGEPVAKTVLQVSFDQSDPGAQYEFKWEIGDRKTVIGKSFRGYIQQKSFY